MTLRMHSNHSSRKFSGADVGGDELRGRCAARDPGRGPAPTSPRRTHSSPQHCAVHAAELHGRPQHSITSQRDSVAMRNANGVVSQAGSCARSAKL